MHGSNKQLCSCSFGKMFQLGRDVNMATVSKAKARRQTSSRPKPRIGRDCQINPKARLEFRFMALGLGL